MSEVHVKGKRNANIELLRIISMLMVTMLHALGKSGLLENLTENPTVNAWISWTLESMSICAVNVFMLISGYFLIKSTFRLSRLIELVLQILFYTVGVFVFFRLIGVVPDAEMDIYWFLNYFLPVHMNVYWFMAAYIVIYALLPILSKGIQSIKQGEFVAIIVILLVYECVLKSILPFSLYIDSKGYSFLWCLIVFLIGAYFRLYGFSKISGSLKGWGLYFISVLLILAETYALQYANSVLGRLKEIGEVSMNYNHIFVLTAAIGIFAAFISFKPMAELPGKIICFLSPMALGVYLFQENMTLRYRWQTWFNLIGSQKEPTFLFLIRLFGAVLAMFAIGTAVDYVRIKIFSGVRLAVSGLSKKNHV